MRAGEQRWRAAKGGHTGSSVAAPWSVPVPATSVSPHHPGADPPFWPTCLREFGGDTVLTWHPSAPMVRTRAPPFSAPPRSRGPPRFSAPPVLGVPPRSRGPPRSRPPPAWEPEAGKSEQQGQPECAGAPRARLPGWSPCSALAARSSVRWLTSKIRPISFGH